MSEKYQPRLLLIGSGGRNSGKTFLACRVIEGFSKSIPLVGVKVTAVSETIDGGELAVCPRGGAGCGACSSLTGDYDIIGETRTDCSKDTSRLLAAGCSAVYWLRARTHALGAAFDALLSRIGGEVFMVCESNSLRKHVRPGVFLVVLDEPGPPAAVGGHQAPKPSCAEVLDLADAVIPSSGGRVEFSISRLSVHGGKWTLDPRPDGPSKHSKEHKTEDPY